MSVPASLLKDLRRGRSDWVINVRVARKYKVQVREGVKIPESIELVLVDSEGARIQATIPKMFMPKYGPKMNESAVYYISNFSVVENRGKYKITEHPLKIIFFNSTDIYSVTGLSFPKKVFSLMSFPDLLALTDVDDCGLIDVVGRLVRKSNVKHIHHQRTSPGEKLMEVVLEDIGNNSLSCTLWGDYADEMFRLIETCGDSPLIVLIQLCKPKSYDGKITISNAFFATKLHVDPIVPEIAELKSFFAVDSGTSHKISQIESSNAYSSFDELESGLANVLTVADLLECKEEGYYWVIGQISEVFVDGCWSFISCKVCMHKLESVESGYFCKGCNNTITKAIPRFKVKVNVHSGDDTAKFMLWDRCCESLVGQSAVELKDHYIKISGSGKKEYCLPHCPDEIIAIVGKTAIFKVHLRDVNISGKDQHYSSGSCFHGKSLVDKYIKEKIKVKKRIDVLAAIKEAGDEVIEINDSCGDNEEKTPENVGLKRRFLSFEDTATSTLTGDGGSSNKDGIHLQKDIKIEKD